MRVIDESASTEVIVFPANEGAIAELKARYMHLKCNGPDDQAAFDAVHDAEQICVKLRTGTVKAVKELCDPLKKQIDRYKADGDKLVGLLAPIELHLKSEKQAVKDEIERRESIKAEELWKLRWRRYLEAIGEPPDSEVLVPISFREFSEADFEAEIQRLQRETFLRREALIRKAEAEAAEAKRRADEAERLRVQNERLAAERAVRWAARSVVKVART